MAPQPKTIGEYQAALLRLGIPMPREKLALSDYKRLYDAAISKQPEHATPAKRKVGSSGGSGSSSRQRTDAGPSRNVPLSSQQPPPVQQSRPQKQMTFRDCKINTDIIVYA